MSDDPARDSAVIAHTLTSGQTVRGVRWGRGAPRVIFLHEPGSDLDAWGSFPRDFARALEGESRAFDLPGHGLSDDPWDSERLPAVISELVALEGPQAGDASFADDPIVIAAGASALAALQIVDNVAIAGLVALSPRGESQGIPRSPKTPKLFFAGSQAGDDLANARRLAAASAGWAVVTSVPVAARGVGLLDTEWHQRIAESIATFVRDCSQSRPRQPHSVVAPVISRAPRWKVR